MIKRTEIVVDNVGKRTIGELNDYVKKLEQALDEIEKYIEEHKHLNWYVESCYKNDLLEIIQKAKGDVKNEN